MSAIYLIRQPNETEHSFLYRIGLQKENGELNCTWNEIGQFLNEETGRQLDPATWRKRYSRIKRMFAVSEPVDEINDSLADAAKSSLAQLQRQKFYIREQRSAFRRQLKDDAINKNLMDILLEAIDKVPKPSEPKPVVPPDEQDRTLLAMLSDVHYGMTFKNVYGSYDSKIAADRINKYADSLIDIAKTNGISSCHVALMGDLISGTNHRSIRIENRENAIEQVIGVSEVIAEFLLKLATHFNKVTVSNVDGNHSRIDISFDDALRAERLDSLIPWYCKARLSNLGNITFATNDIDSTLSVIDIHGKTYVAVHGDFDADLRTAANRMMQIVDKRIDYLLAGHMHIADMRFEDIAMIRNGSVLTGGDEYTAKKRLYGPAVQVAMICSDKGVDSVHPIKLN